VEITITGRNFSVTDAIRAYAEEKIGNSMKVMDIDPLNAEVVLRVEKNPSIALPAICEVTMTAHGHVIRVEEHENDMYAAIDVAAAKVLRQLRKFKTKVMSKAQANQESIRVAPEETDFDALMAELADDEVVRVKDLELEPLTEEEALVQIDLLGHDFFAYTDRDTNAFCVLYRRDNGGYGLLKQVQ